MSRTRVVYSMYLMLIPTSVLAQVAGSIPEGFANAAPAQELMEAWTDKSLWIPNPQFLGGGTCFEFHAWENCEIFEFDAEMSMSDKNGRLCQVREYVVVDSPGMQRGDYGLIVEGVGTSYNYGFLEVIWPTYTSFTPRNGDGPWEVSEEPCSARAKNH